MTTAHAALHVVVLAGNERQIQAAQRLNGKHTSPGESPYILDWLTPGYHPTHRCLATVDKKIAAADLMLIAPRLGTIIRQHAINQARRHGVVIIQMPGAGTGASGIARAAAEAVDGFWRDRGAA
jgi:hypothetical protein